MNTAIKGIRGQTKYRPYFTATELLEIINALKEHPNPSRLALIKYLESFSIKIERGVLEPQITLKPTIEQSLGFSPPSAPTINRIDPPVLYEKWRAGEHLNPVELTAVFKHAYINDLFTPQEEEEYERINGITSHG